MYVNSRRGKSLATKHIKYESYRCAYGKYGLECEMRPTIQGAELETVFDELMLDQMGHVKAMTRHVDPGEDHTAEIETAEQRLAKLESDFVNGKYDTESKEASYWRTLDTLTESINRLKALPNRPASIEWRETGMTFADLWADMNLAEKRDYLTRNGVRVLVFKGIDGEKAVGIVARFGSLQDMAKSAGLDSASLEDWAESQWQCPPHWSMTEEQIRKQSVEWRQMITKTYGGLEVPETLKKLRLAA